MDGERRFHWADYLICIGNLLLSSVVGIYYHFRDRRKSTTDDYLLGGRDMSIIPVAASLVVSLLSAIFVQGAPAEIYAYGIYPVVSIWGFPLAIFIALTFYLPVFHRLGLTSAYEYLELRFNRTVRLVCSGLSMIQMVCYSSVALYAPTIAISQAIGLPIWACILITALICTFYTTLGGYKTVLWTDTLQAVVIFVGLLAVLFKGAADAGGIEKVMNISRIGARLTLENVVPDPRLRHTVWNAFGDEIPFTLAMYATSQFAVQRFCSMRNINRARLAMALSVPITVAMFLLAVFIGLTAFTYYYGCDPVESGRIISRDQTLSLIVMDVFKDNPGMAGVFLSSVLSAALSTLSSVQNSFAAILLEDFLKPLYQRLRAQPLEEKTATIISKVIVFLVGVTITCLSLGVSKSGKLVLYLASCTLSIGSAPILGIFTMGLLVPFSNAKGALAGLASGVLLLGWIVVGSLSTPKTLHKPLPTRTDLCSMSTSPKGTFSPFNSTHADDFGYHVNHTTVGPVSTTSGGLSELYRVSYVWFALIGTLSSIIMGLLISLLTNGWKNRKHVKADLLFSWKRHGYNCCLEEDKTADVTLKDQEISLMRGTTNI